MRRSFKAEDCGKEQNDIKLGGLKLSIACSMNPIKIKETIKNEDGSIYEEILLAVFGMDKENIYLQMAINMKVIFLNGN